MLRAKCLVALALILYNRRSGLSAKPCLGLGAADILKMGLQLMHPCPSTRNKRAQQLGSSTKPAMVDKANQPPVHWQPLSRKVRSHSNLCSHEQNPSLRILLKSHGQRPATELLRGSQRQPVTAPRPALSLLSQAPSFAVDIKFLAATLRCPPDCSAGAGSALHLQ